MDRPGSSAFGFIAKVPRCEASGHSLRFRKRANWNVVKDPVLDNHRHPIARPDTGLPANLLWDHYLKF
jgi:hypothetical protein